VACQRSTQLAQVFAVPSMGGVVPCAGVGGGSQKPSDATARWMPNSAAVCQRAMAGVEPQPLEDLGCQVLKARAAVEQEGQAGDRRQPLVLGPADPVSPPAEDVSDPLHRLVGAVLAEHAAATASLSNGPMLRNAVNPPTR
jgi:hypothetical protein